MADLRNGRPPEWRTQLFEITGDGSLQGYLSTDTCTGRRE